MTYKGVSSRECVTNTRFNYDDNERRKHEEMKKNEWLFFCMVLIVFIEYHPEWFSTKMR